MKFDVKTALEQPAGECIGGITVAKSKNIYQRRFTD